ncbi:MAG: hypothetical protein K8F31_11720 [Roseovarius sp.]|nr:hypothetical protein [Roseovarius sp.]
MPDDRRPGRHGFEPFECAPALRLEAQERFFALQNNGLAQRLDKIEASLERLERRLWLAVYGVAAALLAQAVLPLLTAAP